MGWKQLQGRYHRLHDGRLHDQTSREVPGIRSIYHLKGVNRGAKGAKGFAVGCEEPWNSMAALRASGLALGGEIERSPSGPCRGTGYLG